MTLEEALQIVDAICAQVQLNRQGHIQLQTAIAVIQDATMKDGGKTTSNEEVNVPPTEPAS